MTKEQYFEFLGIYKFWDAGYKGKNVRIMSGESIEKDYCKMEEWSKIICPQGYANSNDHGSSVMRIMLQVCPEATYYSYYMNYSNGKSDCCEYIKENKIHLFTTSSIGPSVNKNLEKCMQECIDEGCTFFAAAGNDGESGVRGMSKSEKYLAIGICDFVGGKLQRVSPSSIGKELDYVMLPPWGRWTSWCSPTFCAMCGLVQDFFIENTGKVLNREKLIDFIDDNIIDLDVEGVDEKTGKGLFILPDPSTIDIYKYVGGGNMEISKNGLDLIKKWEGCRLTAYQDIVGVWTIGYGTTNADIGITGITIKSGLTITKEQAEEWLLESIKRKYLPKVEKYSYKYNFNQNQIDALVSFAYNIGSIDQLTANGTRSISEISKHILAYNTAGGKVVQGLTNRRKEEKELFDKDVDNVDNNVDNNVSDWAKTAWEWCKESGYLDGTNPKGVVNREMMAQIIYNLYHK